MIGHPDKAWLYLSPPKCASTTMRSVLLSDAFGGVEVGGQHCTGPIPADYQNCPLIFISVRNPYARIDFMYRKRRERAISLPHSALTPDAVEAMNLVEFIAAGFLYPQWTGGVFTPITYHAKQFTKVLHVESLQADFDTLNIGRVVLPTLHRTTPEGYDWRTGYTQEAADAVYQKMQADFEAFGYEKDSWKTVT